MSTTTPDPQKTRTEEEEVTSVATHPLQGWLLILLVFVAGAASLAVEMAASRLLAPYFGTSLFVWANLIGLILLYLTIGYYVGGLLADRHPSPTLFYTLTIVAAQLISLIPLISRPILNWALTAFATYSVSVFYGSLASVLLLFAIPMILLGCVSPFAIRLRIEQVGKSGHTAGLLYAISTAGSIVGTFVPVLVLIPDIGTYRTFFVFAIALLLVSLIGLIASRKAGPQPPRKGRPENLLTLLLLVPALLTLTGMQGPIKPPDGSNGAGTLVTERESAYNYIQVVRVGEETQLVLNEGVGIHSIYDPNHILTSGPWDYFLIAPYFNRPPFTPSQVRSLCVIGLGAGTLAREFSAIYGPIPIDGVEIDSEIVKLGRQYFDMNEPNLHVIIQDGRYFLRTTPHKYDVIAMDAYQQPYIPFQLTTVEFFQEARAHLTPNGVIVANVGRTSHDYRLVEAMAQTMHSVFPNVYIID
jgi:predicted membrane-bound spermidine synthase